MTQGNSFKNFSSIALGKIFSSALQATFYLIFATLLEPEIYGQMSYIIALAGTFSVISRFGLSQTIVVYQAKQNQSASNQVNVFSLITIGIISIILIPINPIAALLCFALSLFIMNQQNLLGLKEYKKYFWIGIIKGILIITLPISLFFVLEIPGILIGMAISNFVLSFNFLKSLNTRLESFRYLRDNYKVLIHNFGVESSTSLTRWIDKLLIVPLFGFASVGLYQFNIQILFALSLLSLSVHSFLLTEESSGKSHKKISYLAITSSILLVILVIVLSPHLIPQFFPKYSEGIPSLQILIISLIPLSITSILNAKLQAKESTRVGFSAVIRIISLLMFLAVFGSLYGINGLSMAVLFSVILETIFLSILYKRK